MAKQLNLLETGQIVPTALHTEMQQSYLEYAMSVIVGRALPDARDGLKPVHRRILYAMHELGLTPDRPFRKCARVVGDVLGKYHPHGDQSVYDALVRMVQTFSSRYPLLAGHGNFGSVDNDPPAAMRYTETRLGAIANEALLSEIGEATVDFIDNFDNSQQEPVVLPAQLPILLLNGCSGIAVGMATNVPPHNLNEVVDGLIALINDPELSDKKLFKIIPGPDFPTGGEIVDTKNGIEQAYLTGRGSIPMRGIATIEEIKGKGRRRDKTAIVITELPFQVNKASWIEKIADLVNQGKIEGIADIRDESDREGMRVVIELKRDGNPHLILDDLYRLTPLQSNFGAIMLALVDKQPRQLSLREILEEFLTFREQTLTRRYNHELEGAQRRLHTIEGLLIALTNLDEVIDILRNSPDGSTAKVRFQADLGISDTQSDSILAMPMRRITGLERKKLEQEAQELRDQIAQLELLLRDRGELLKNLKKELRSLKRKFGNERRTRIVDPETQPTQPLSPKLTQKRRSQSKSKNDDQPTLFSDKPPENAILEITNGGYVYWTTPENATSGGYSTKRNEDFVVFSQPIQKHEQLIVVAEGGKAYPVNIPDVPSQTSVPKTMLSLLPKSMQDSNEKIISYFFPPADPQAELVLLSTQGRIKRLPLSELNGLGNRGLMLIKLKDKDTLSHCCWTYANQEVIIATTGGRLLRFAIKDEQIPVMGRNAQGNQVSRLRPKEEFAGCVSVNAKNPDSVLLISAAGYLKRLEVKALRSSSRGDLGTQAMQFTNKTDQVFALTNAGEGTQVMLQTDKERALCITVDDLKIWGKDGAGDRLKKLKNDETILEVIPLSME
jgi:DNA gyrase subunit A